MADPDDIIAALFDELAEPVEPPAPPEARRAERDASRALVTAPRRLASGPYERLTTDELRRACAILAEIEDRPGWPDWWWGKVTIGQHAAIRKLWFAVVKKALDDAVGDNGARANEQRDALDWLRGCARDRALVCSAIDIDPETFSHRALAYVARQTGGAA